MLSTLLFAASLGTPPPPAFPLTVESIMRGYGLVGHAPRNLRWNADGTRLRFQWAKADGKSDPPLADFIVNADGLGLSGAPKLTPEEAALGDAPRVAGKAVFEAEGDLFLFDEGNKKTRRLTRTNERESNPLLFADGKEVGYERAGNLYRLDLETGETDQLTEVKPATVPEPTEPKNPSQQALSAEQQKLFFQSPNGDQRRGRRRRGNAAGSAVVVTVPLGYEAQGLTLAPSGSFAAIQISKSPKGVRSTQVPNYMARNGYTEMIPSYEKVGDAQPTGKALLANLASGAIIDWSAPRDANFWYVKWSPDGSHAIAFASSLDHKDAWILGFDAASAKTSVLWVEHDDAWVGGPGLGRADFLPDGSRIYFETEKTGFAQLMTMAPDGTDVKAMTSGAFEVSNLTLDKDRNRFLFVSSEGSPFTRHLDALPFAGGSPQKLADMSADDDAAYALSNDGKNLAIVRSTANRPPELFVNEIQVTHTPTDEWLSGPWIQPPIVQISARDGASIPGHLYRPPNWKRGGPAVLFVHGAGYLQNVYEGWSYYYREYMFHHILMSKGYAVLDADYRASAGYGKSWRTAIYRHMGGKDLDDNVDAAKWLVKELGADPKRLGIYGGSYGGFITLMAMFTTPDVFAAGAALRPVCDWANYNHDYTSAILNQPQDDKQAYEQSSPIYFASGLKGSLLICHGMVDTNVHFQDSVRLVEKLIELGKPDFELAPYPIEDHGFQKPASWTDEYRRILNLFERTIGSGYRTAKR